MPEGLVDREVRYPFAMLPFRPFMTRVLRDYDLAAELDDDTGRVQLPSVPTVGKSYLFERRRLGARAESEPSAPTVSEPRRALGSVSVPLSSR